MQILNVSVEFFMTLCGEPDLKQRFRVSADDCTIAMWDVFCAKWYPVELTARDHRRAVIYARMARIHLTRKNPIKYPIGAKRV